ncbi:MAG: LPS-assembly protein LptD [Kiritimatiellia bacterium]
MTRSLCVLLFGFASSASLGLSTATEAAELRGRTQGAATPIEVRSDKIEWMAGWVVCQGNVIVVQGSDEVRCDTMWLNERTQQVIARGNVVLKRGKGTWQCAELRGNLATGEWQAKVIKGFTDPLYWKAASGERSGEGVWALNDGTVTTCRYEDSHSHYRIRANRITIVPGQSVGARGAKWYFGPVPVFYLPYWSKDLTGDSGFDLRPGYNSRMGAFFLGSYKRRVAPSLKTRTHLDYRTRRGIAVGEDLEWEEPQAGRWVGDLTVYYADDREPYDESDLAAGEEITNERYRIRLRQSFFPTPRDTVMLRANYLSDSDMLEDFFEPEFRQFRQPENYLSYVHRQDAWTLGVLVRKRLNDFYTSVERVPEITFDLIPQPLGASRIYYDEKTAASFLSKRFERGSTDTDYETIRFDTRHQFYRPTKLFGFLSVTPRAAWRGTYYADAPPPSNIATNATAGNTGGSVVRSIFELGLDASLRMFRTTGDRDEARRHIVEPYLAYRFVPEPSHLPQELYQFDEVDELKKKNLAQLGMRNKWQRKAGGCARDVAEADLYATFNLDPEEQGHNFEKVTWDANIWPWRGALIEVDGEYDAVQSKLHTLNTRLQLQGSDTVKLDLEHRFRSRNSNLLTARTVLAPSRAWVYDLYGRYELEESRMEEIGLSVQHNLDCLAVRTGAGAIPGYTDAQGIEHSTEWRFIVELWVLAFPRVKIGGRFGG